VATIALLGGLSHLAQAQFEVYNNTITTAFQSAAIGPSGGTLAFSDTAASPSGYTIAGGSAITGSANAALGETFYWSGATAELTAFALVSTGEGGSQTYQPFLFDLGSSLFNSSTTGFAPNNYVNMLATGTITDPALSSGLHQLEIDIAAGVTLTQGQSYAIGLQNTSANWDIFLQKSSGGQSDPDGEGFTFSGGLSSTAYDNPSPFAGSPRDVFMGLYTTTAVPEPSTIALGVIGASSFLLRRRIK